MTRLTVNLAALLLCTLLAGNSTNASVAPTDWPEFDNVTYLDPAQAYQLGSLWFTECRVNDLSETYFRHMDCAAFQVPEDYRQPEGRQITLFVARIKASGKKNQPDPLVPLAGGPGAAASELYAFQGQGLDKIQQHRDLIIIDQRGTGKSNKLSCPGVMETVDAFAEWDYDDDELKQLVDDCVKELPGKASLYTTSVAVRDLDGLRQALAVPEWNLYGSSYGTRVAQHYLRRYPQHTRAVILDAVAHPQLNLGYDIALQSERALAQMIERCRASAACRKRFPELKAGIDKLLNRLEKKPLTVEVEDFSTGEKVKITLTRQHLAVLIRMYLYTPETAALLPLLLHEAYAKENFEPLARTLYNFSESFSELISVGVHNTAACSEDIAFLDRQSLDMAKLEATYLGAAQFEQLLKICDYWPTGLVDDDFKQPVKSDVPVLLLSGGADPITPPAYAEMAAEFLSKSKHIVADDMGHGLAKHGCIPTLLAKFVDQASWENLDADCTTKLRPSPFFIDFNGPAP